jgi:Mg-chelatase subunit ChlD
MVANPSGTYPSGTDSSKFYRVPSTDQQIARDREGLDLAITGGNSDFSRKDGSTELAEAAKTPSAAESRYEQLVREEAEKTQAEQNGKVDLAGGVATAGVIDLGQLEAPRAADAPVTGYTRDDVSGGDSPYVLSTPQQKANILEAARAARTNGPIGVFGGTGGFGGGGYGGRGGQGGSSGAVAYPINPRLPEDNAAPSKPTVMISPHTHALDEYDLDSAPVLVSRTTNQTTLLKSQAASVLRQGTTTGSAAQVPGKLSQPAADAPQFVAEGPRAANGMRQYTNTPFPQAVSVSSSVNLPAPIVYVLPVPQPEVQTRDNAFSTFSLNVSDVSFKLAAASLAKGQLPEPSTVRSEEFINAFDYRDTEPAPGAPIGFAWERAGYPFAHNRDLLRFSVKTTAQGREAGRPLNLVLLVDKSGSMERADRVAILREALRALATELRTGDTISVVVFARTARLLADGAPGSQAGALADALAGITPEGGTNLEEAMKLAYETALRHYLANGENRVVILTDGAANLGDVEPEDLRRRVEAHRAQGVALDCFGVGWEDYNDHLLELLSRAGGGRYGFVNTPEEAATEFAGQLAGALRVAASDVKVQVEFNPDRVVSYRQIGYAKDQLKKEEFRDNTVKAAQLGVRESGNALYTVELAPAGDGPIATVYVRYRAPGTSDYYEHQWAVPYDGVAPALDQASPAMRLAAVASAFSEWLASSPYAGEVSLDRLLGYVRGVPQLYGADTRPAQLERMIVQARSLSGK